MDDVLDFVLGALDVDDFDGDGVTGALVDTVSGDMELVKVFGRDER